MRFFKLSAIVLSAAVMSACGGSSGGASSSPEPSPVSSAGSVAANSSSSLKLPEQSSSSAVIDSSSIVSSNPLVTPISSYSSSSFSSSLNSDSSSVAVIASSLDISSSSGAVVSSSFSQSSSIVSSSLERSSSSAVISSSLNQSSSSVLASSSSSSSTLPAVSSSSIFSSSSSTLSSSAGIIYYVRGTFNGWEDEDNNYVLSPVGSSNNYQLCIYFDQTDGGNGFKVDPKGGWGGDELPLLDNYSVDPGWVNISFNSADQVIGTQQNLAANCVVNSSSSAAIFSSVASSTSSSSSVISSSVTSSSLSLASSSNTSSSLSLVSSSAAASSLSLASTSTISSSASVSSGGVNINTAADVKAAAGTLDSRLACFKGGGEKACNLRTYQVMVESFVNGDDTINMNLGYGTSHHKGDLQGVINSLDYIKSLGVNTLWLTPVFDSTGGYSPSQLDASGYFASDFFNIDKYFGSKDKLKELVDSAHAKGLYVLLDGVFGHAKFGAANYSIASPGGRKLTGNSNPLPYPDNLEFFKEVAAYWITHYKIDGWRLDQAYQVPVQYWSEIRSVVEAASNGVTYIDASGNTVNPLGYMVGEVWKDEEEIAATGYGAEGSPALLSNFDFPMRYRLVQTLAMQEEGAYVKNPASHLNGGFDSHKVYPDHAKPNLMLTNHDLVRFGDLIQRSGVAGPNDDQYWGRHRAALSFLAAYSGPITLYYGDEIGQEVANFASKHIQGCSSYGHCDDHVSRDSGVVEGVTGSLNSKQLELKRYVASLMNLREAHPALWNGSRTYIYGGASVYMDRKDKGDDHILYALNTTNTEVRISVAATAIGASGDLLDLLDSSRIYRNDAGVYYLVLAPFQALFLKITH